MLIDNIPLTLSLNHDAVEMNDILAKCARLFSLKKKISINNQNTHASCGSNNMSSPSSEELQDIGIKV